MPAWAQHLALCSQGNIWLPGLGTTQSIVLSGKCDGSARGSVGCYLTQVDITPNQVRISPQFPLNCICV